MIDNSSNDISILHSNPCFIEKFVFRYLIPSLTHTQEQFKHISFSEIKENMNNINSLGKSLNVYPIPYRKMLKFLYS